MSLMWPVACQGGSANTHTHAHTHSIWAQSLTITAAYAKHTPAYCTCTCPDTHTHTHSHTPALLMVPEEDTAPVMTLRGITSCVTTSCFGKANITSHSSQAEQKELLEGVCLDRLRQPCVDANTNQCPPTHTPAHKHADAHMCTHPHAHTHMQADLHTHSATPVPDGEGALGLEAKQGLGCRQRPR